MPSLPPFDGVAIPSCAGIHADGTTIRAIDAHGVDGKSLPITTSTGEHDIFSSLLRNHGGGMWSDGCTTNAVSPSESTRPLGKGVDGAITCYHRGGNAITKLGSSFNASSVLSLPPTPNHGGNSRRDNGTLPATTEVATPLLSSARPALPTWSSPTHSLPMMWGSAAKTACCALECSQQRMAVNMSKYPGFADANPWVMENINTVARELQCW